MLPIARNSQGQRALQLSKYYVQGAISVPAQNCSAHQLPPTPFACNARAAVLLRFEERRGSCGAFRHELLVLLRPLPPRELPPWPLLLPPLLTLTLSNWPTIAASSTTLRGLPTFTRGSQLK